MTLTSKKQRLLIFLKSFVDHYRQANVSDSAVVLAYYTLLSIFPLFMIIGSLLEIVNVGYSHLLTTVMVIFPSRIYRLLRPILYSALSDGSKKQLSIGLVIALWTSSRMIAAFQRTVNQAYGILKSSPVLNRLFSFLWNFLFISFIIIFMFFISFGRYLLKVMNRYVGHSIAFLNLLDRFQGPLTLISLFIVISAVYDLVPFAKVKLRFIWLGSLTVTLGLVILSKAFSFYLRYFSHSFTAYQTLGTFILLMLWLYLLGILLLTGAVLNATLQGSSHNKRLSA